MKNKPLLENIGNCPNGAESKVLRDIVNRRNSEAILYLSENEEKALRLKNLISFFDPTIRILYFPDWGCLPYDKSPVKKNLIAQRIKALFQLSSLKRTSEKINKTIIITTMAGAIQKIPPEQFFKKNYIKIFPKLSIRQEKLLGFLNENGYSRTSLVQQHGDFSVRGDIIDVFSSDLDEPVRIDFFNDMVESIRSFNPASQRTIRNKSEFSLLPMNELSLDIDSINLFRENYRNLFGTNAGKDKLYQSVSSGIECESLHHWAPLFHENMPSLFQFISPNQDRKIKIAFQEGIENKVNKIFYLIDELYESRLSEEGWYKPLPTNYLYLSKTSWKNSIHDFDKIKFSPFKIIKNTGSALNLKSSQCIDPNFEKKGISNIIRSFEKSRNKKLIIAFDNQSSQQKLGRIFLKNNTKIKSWDNLNNENIFSTILDIENGFVVDDVTFMSEKEAFGLKKKSTKIKEYRNPKNIISEITSLSVGNLVVHQDHGIGKYDGLKALQVNNVLHDYLQITYAKEDKLFVPVENIDTLSRFGDGTISDLDTLGSIGWQKRKSKTKGFIRSLAKDLIRIEAKRKINKAIALTLSTNQYEKFSSHFPYIETSDQEEAIKSVVQDISTTIPMDRLICGDVGFGKTEIALRAAFVAVSSGVQVVVIVPTTLLAIQHYETFKNRFKDFKVSIAQLSRLVPKSKFSSIKSDLANGHIDIVIGTHALLSKDITFDNLGLLIIDEEQHFGVRHKEKIKELRSNIHILTLTATPIPRTLQLALVGVREMSLIATPPSNRLGIDTFILPYDPLIIRRVMMREMKRGGQIFFVCPRIKDITDIHKKLKKMFPEIKITVAHGQMSPKQLDRAMLDFYQGDSDLLLSTSIIESGLDIPKTNTIIIYRADLFGLSQLHQLRGRVGRSATKAYAYLTYSEESNLSSSGKKRLEVINKLDSLGVGFSLASYDLDIRGAGNLLGAEQSGHIREVGVELYQEMLREAVSDLKRNEKRTEKKKWSPKILLGEPVYIPEWYVADLNIRLNLYKKISLISSDVEMKEFTDELTDRFGQVPNEVKNLADIISIKRLCLNANISRLELGSKGIQIFFQNGHFANPEGLIDLIKKSKNELRLKSNSSFIFKKTWGSYKEKILDTKILLNKISRIAKKAQ